MAQAPGHGVPGHGFSAEAAAAFGFKSGDTGTHGGNVAIRKIKWHGVRVERRSRVNLGTALDDADVHAVRCQVRCERATCGAGTDDQDIVDLFRHSVTKLIQKRMSREAAGDRSKPAGPHPVKTAVACAL